MVLGTGSCSCAQNTDDQPVIQAEVLLLSILLLRGRAGERHYQVVSTFLPSGYSVPGPAWSSGFQEHLL